MVNKKNTRRALFMSITSLILCCAMLMGTTFAWFTDSVTSSNNIIKSGTLDVEMYWAEGTTDPDTADWRDASTGAIFDYEQWEPGYTQVRHIKIVNEGTLAMKYQLQINANGDVTALTDAIDVYYIDPAQKINNRTELTDANKLGTLTNVLAGMSQSASGVLEKEGDSVNVTLALKMRETAGNEYQDMSIGSNFSVVLMATQQEAEKDSFGTDYDAKAYLPDVAPVSVVADITPDEETFIGNDSTNALIPANAVADDVTEITLKVEETKVNPNVTVATDAGALTFDVSFVDQNGNKVVFNEAVTVNQFIGKNLKDEGLYHYSDEITYVYDANTGILSFRSKDYSPFTVTYAYGGGLGTAAAPYVIETAGHLKSAVADGGYFVLANNISVDADETMTIASGTNVVLNLNNKTISGESDQTSDNRNMFCVKGNMSVSNGSITVFHAGENMEWNKSTNVFDVTAGGVLNINDANVKNLGGSDMAIGIHLNNWGEVTLNINNATVESTYCAVRVFNSGNNMNNVTIKNSTIATTGNRAFWVHNYSGDNSLLNFDIFGNDNTYVAETNTIGAPIRYGFDNPVYFNSNGIKVITDVTALDQALLTGETVAMGGNMTFNASETTANSGYGATGVSVKGGTLDGNGNSLGINNWDTWDAAVHTTGGTIKNLTINSGMRGIFMGSATSDVYIDNVTIDGTIYTFNSDGGNKNYGVYISNSTLKGWTSHSDVHKEVVYTNCEFGAGNGYAFCRPYGPTQFINCTFEEGFEFDTAKTSDITFENCYYGDTLITAENAASLTTGETVFFYNGLNDITIK